MMLRLQLMRRRKTNAPGTLVCAACGARFQFALWERRRCKRCFDKRAFVRRTTDPELRLDTDSLIAECREQFGNIPITGLADRLGIPQQTLNAWTKRIRGDRGMMQINARVSAALDKLTEVTP